MKKNKNYNLPATTYPLRIGIVGGGQLGRMMTIAAKKLGLFVTILDPVSQSPAGQIADKQIVGNYTDEQALRELAQVSDVITVEVEIHNEHILHLVLSEIIKKGTQVHPPPETLSIIQDKLIQKQFFKKHAIATAPFQEVTTVQDIENLAKKFMYPLLLKARTGAYDGKGNFVVHSKTDIKKGMKKLEGQSLYVEKYIPFAKELAVMIARSTTGKTALYPVTQTIHKDNICDLVIVPAHISQRARKQAEFLAKKTLRYLKGAGVFGIEMFLTKKGVVLINEIAPRVHNAGHYTIEACITSQFEQHIRAITGLPLGSTKLITKAAVMKNILGKHEGSGFPTGLEKALKLAEVSVHLYGKKESRPQRKMGHITVIGNSVEECLKKTNKARRMLVL